MLSFNFFTHLSGYKHCFYLFACNTSHTPNKRVLSVIMLLQLWRFPLIVPINIIKPDTYSWKPIVNPANRQCCRQKECIHSPIMNSVTVTWDWVMVMRFRGPFIITSHNRLHPYAISSLADVYMIHMSFLFKCTVFLELRKIILKNPLLLQRPTAEISQTTHRAFSK